VALSSLPDGIQNVPELLRDETFLYQMLDSRDQRTLVDCEVRGCGFERLPELDGGCIRHVRIEDPLRVRVKPLHVGWKVLDPRSGALILWDCEPDGRRISPSELVSSKTTPA
jgi:hypothetical protein